MGNSTSNSIFFSFLFYFITPTHIAQRFCARENGQRSDDCKLFSIVALICWRRLSPGHLYRSEKRKDNTSLNNSLYTDPPLPLSLELVQEAVRGFTTFYSVCLRRQCVLLGSKDKREVTLCSLGQPFLVTFAHASSWVMSQELHNQTILDKHWHTCLVSARSLQF